MAYWVTLTSNLLWVRFWPLPRGLKSYAEQFLKWHLDLKLTVIGHILSITWAVTWKNTRFGGMGANQIQATWPLLGTQRYATCSWLKSTPCSESWQLSWLEPPSRSRSQRSVWKFTVAIAKIRLALRTTVTQKKNQTGTWLFGSP